MKKKTLNRASMKFLSSILALFMLCAGIFQLGKVDIHAASNAALAKKAYASFLSKSVRWSDTGSYSPSDLKFGVADINNDKIPELYVQTKKWDYDYDYKLYGYISGKVKCLYSLKRGSKITKIYPSKGIIVTYGEYSNGRTEAAYLKYDGKKITKKASVSTAGSSVTYKKGTTRISKSAYNTLVKQLTGSAASKNPPKLYHDSASNRKLYLTGSTSSSIISSSAKTLSMTRGKKKQITLSFKSNTGTISYYVANTNIISCQWGNFSGSNIPLTVTAKQKGTTTITITNTVNSEKIVIKVTVS